MKIKEESIRELLAVADIVYVVGDYVHLKQSGRNYVALCPFHKEKTPSFTVSRDKGLFHCFGCGVGGNVVTFLMKLENLTFVDAIETLAKKFGVKLEYETTFYPRQDEELEKLYEYSSIASLFFQKNLLETNEGSSALKYLQDRGIDENTIKLFRLGYALSAWDGLINFIRKNNYDLRIFESLGLIIRKNNDEYYDRFRGRIIFPIFSEIGRVIAFGGRILEDAKSDQPKYMNSPESKIYTKGKTLYGLFQTKDEIRKNQSAILVEGYMDFLSLFQNGIKNVVASAGTSLTINQIFTLKRYASNINLIFDGDEAGQNAAKRSIELILQTEANFKIVSLPENEDPDSFIRKFGKDKFLSLIDEGKNYIDYVFDLAQKKNLLKDTNSKIKVIDSLLESTARVQDPLRREILAQEIAKKFNVTENSVLQKLNNYVNNYIKVEKKQINSQNYFETPIVDKKLINNISPIEKGILKLICEVDQFHLNPIFEHIDETDFLNPLAGEIFKLLKQNYFNLKSGEKINSQLIINQLETEELKSIFSDALIEKYKISEGWNEVEEYSSQNTNLNRLITDYIKKLKEISLRKKLDELNNKYSNSVDLDEITKILEESNKIIAKQNFYKNFKFDEEYPT
ncbi:MAG: DNA primase [Ignavibacteria bacterium]|nr:DNA primase [Ignavibacteria bacterium]